MKLKKIKFGLSEPGERHPRSFAKRVLFAALLITLGAVGVAGHLSNDLRANGDREHLENPGGYAMAGSMKAEDRDPRVLNGEATPFLGTTWIELVAMISGLVALLAAGWLCMRHAVATGMKDTVLSMARTHADAARPPPGV